MAIQLTPQDTAAVINSLKKYFSRELDQELGELQARLLLDYIMKEISLRLQPRHP